MSNARNVYITVLRLLTVMLINRLLPSIVICSAIHVKRDLKHSVGRFPRSDRNTKPVSSTFRDMYLHLSREDIIINRPKGGSPSPTSLAHLLDCIPPKFVFFAAVSGISLAVLLLDGPYKLASRTCLLWHRPCALCCRNKINLSPMILATRSRDREEGRGRDTWDTDRRQGLFLCSTASPSVNKISDWCR